MAASMTGFGETQAKNEKISLSIQIKSVNGRYFEPKFKIPKFYLGFENELKAELNKNFFRGHIEVFIYRTEQNNSEKEIIIDTALAKSWISASKKLSKDIKLKFSPTVEQVLKIPDIMRFPETSAPDSEEKMFLDKAFAQAVENCLRERIREGVELVRNLTDLLREIRNFAQNVEKRKIEIHQNLREQLEKKLRLLSGDFQLDPQRLHQEAIFLLDRADVSEEIVRLNAHVVGFDKALKEKGSIGKKLEFLIQEMHREVNTIGSKTQALDIMEQVIETKANIERMREQVQNIE